MRNVFHRKGGMLFKLDGVPQSQSDRVLRGIFVEVECDHNLKELMMCGPYSNKLNVDGHRNEQTDTIVHRFWK